MNKVFCLGMHKTGTASVREALKILGYNNFCNSRDELLNDIKNDDWDEVFSTVNNYDAFKGWPWAVIYRELDRRYPGSKFIITVRDNMESWIVSSIRHFWTEETPMRKWIFGHGSPVGNERKYVQVHEQHVRDVINYFSDRPDDLLIFNIFQERDPWQVLADFIQIEIPNVKFPRANRKRLNRRYRDDIEEYLNKNIYGKTRSFTT